MTFLNTGFILFGEFLRNEANSEKCLYALEKLVDYDMAPSSKGMLYYLAGKMESQRNNHEKVNYWLNKFKDEFPILYKFILESDNKFDLRQLKDELKNNWL